MEKVQREHGGQGTASIQDKRMGSLESGVREGREREAGWMKGWVCIDIVSCFDEEI